MKTHIPVRRRAVRPARLGLVLLLMLGAFAGAPVSSRGMADTTPPTLAIAGEAVDGPVVLDHIALVYDEPIDPTSIPDAADFTFRVMPPGPFPSPEPTPPPYVPATGLTLLYQGFMGSPNFFPTGLSLFRLDLGTTVAIGDTVSLTYTPGIHRLRDLAGNEVVAFSGDVGFFTNVNGVLPFIDDGLGPDKLLLMTSRALDPALPPASDFKVTVNSGTPQSATAVELRLPGYGLGFLVLTLATPVAAGDVVELSYTETSPVLTYLEGLPIGSFANFATEVSLPVTPSRETPTGTNVEVAPPDSTTGIATATITFASVVTAGTTTLESSATGPVAPAGFEFGDPPVYYDLSTTAVFASAEVCFSYSPTSFNPPESALRLMHYEGGAWTDVTAAGYPDTVNHVICGTVSSFSPFAVAGLPQISFSGFLAPVDNLPVVNLVKPGSAVPVRFSLGGNIGLSIFAAGSPSSQAISCDGGDPVDIVEQTLSPGSATLSYSAGTTAYTYAWKTDKAWTGCRRLTLTFVDGSSATAEFSFR